MKRASIGFGLAIWAHAMAAGCGEGEGEDMGQPVAPVCGQGQAYASIDFAGVWHFEIAYDPAQRYSSALRVERGGDDYSASMYGIAAKASAFDDSGMVVEVEFPTDEGAPARTGTLRACDMDTGGYVRGSYEYCIGETCYDAELSGRKVEPLDEPEASGLTLIASYNGPASGEWRADGARTLNVRVHDGLAYLARGDDGLRIADLSDETAVVERGHMPVMYEGESYNDVKIVPGPNARLYALMASNKRGAVVIDVTDPDAPFEVTTFPDASAAPEGVPSVHTLFVEGSRAYLAYTYDDSLRIYDVSDPAQPQHIGGWRHPRLDSASGYVHDLYVQNGRAYLNYWGLGMAIVDTLDDPQDPTLVGEYVDYGHSTSHSNWVTTVGDRTISVHGDEQYGAHVRIVDVDDTGVAFLDTLGSYQTRPEVSVHNIVAHGSLAYVTYYQDGLRVLDLEDPENPTEIAHYQTWPGAGPEYGWSFYEGAIGIDFDPDTGLIYVADTHRGLFVLTLE